MDDSKIKLLVIDDDLVLLEQVEGILRPTYEVSLAPRENRPSPS